MPIWPRRPPSPPSSTSDPPPPALPPRRAGHRRSQSDISFGFSQLSPPLPPLAPVKREAVTTPEGCRSDGDISGLCTAQALATRHGVSDVLVTEARARPGGNITTVERPEEGYLWEEGPNSFQPSDPVLTMAVDSGLKDDLLFGDPNALRFVLWERKLRPVPSKPADLPFFDLMSIPGKLKAGLGTLGIRPPPPGREESVEDFVRRNLGAEVFERLIEPFYSGVYAGDPSKLSMKAAFGKVWRLEVVLLVEPSKQFRRGGRVPNHREIPAFRSPIFQDGSSHAPKCYYI